jgi:hypothetical protein
MMSKPFVFRNKMCKYEELYVSFLLSNINKVYYIVDTQKKNTTVNYFINKIINELSLKKKLAYILYWMLKLKTIKVVFGIVIAVAF